MMARFFYLLPVIFLLGLAPDTPAFAQAVTMEPANTCTDGPQFRNKQQVVPHGIASDIYHDIQVISLSITQTLFNSIQGNGEFQNTIGAILTLYVALYGAFFALGMIRANTNDFVSRLIKIAILVILLSPNAWTLFRDNVVNFFNTGTNDMLSSISALAVDGIGIGGDSRVPLFQIDRALSIVLSSNMAVHLLAMLFTPPYGLLYLVMLAIALWAFVGMLLTALWVFLTATVLRALLFGVAPLFLACMLFDKTRHLFTGWLNQVFSTCLQPIMLFTFFTFFALIATKFIDEIVRVPVCWSEASESLEGTPFNMHFWRFTVKSPTTATKYEPYGGSWGWNGPVDAPNSGSTFPIPFMTVLMFLAMSELGRRFTQVVLMIARDLSASGVDLSSMQNALSDLMPKEAAQSNASELSSMRKSMEKGTLVTDLKEKIAGAVSGRLGPKKAGDK